MKIYCLDKIFTDNNKEKTRLTDTDQKYINIIVDKNFDIDINYNESTTSCNINIVKKIFNYIYCIFVLLNISWTFIIAIVKSVSYHDITYVRSDVFTVVFIMLYFINLLSDYKNHFVIMVRQDIKYIKGVSIAFIISTIISTILTIITVVLLFYNFQISLYSIYLEEISNKLLLYFAVSLATFYGYNILFSNIIILCTVFIVHSDEIKQYSKCFLDFIKNRNNLDIDSIIKDYSSIKERYSESVDRLNNIFSIITVIGLINSYFITVYYSVDCVGFLHYVQIIIFLITECVYLYVISRVNDAVLTILNVVNSSTFMSKFMNRIGFKNLPSGELENKNSQHDMTVRLMIKTQENVNSIDWIILNTKLNVKWTYFSICGFEFDDSTFIKQIVTIFAGSLMILNISSIFV